MLDPEVEAISKCTQVLIDLNEEAKIRVLQYLVNRFNLSPPNKSFSPAPVANTYTDASPINLLENSNSEFISVDYPSIRDVVTKNLPKSEVEWILIYCFYCSAFGSNDFTRDHIINMYDESKRKTINNLKNYAFNISSAVKKDWIKSINNNDYIMLEGGIAYANEVLKGKSATKPRKVIKRKSKVTE